MEGDERGPDHVRRAGASPGIAHMVIAILVIAIVVIAGVGVYFVLSSSTTTVRTATTSLTTLSFSTSTSSRASSTSVQTAVSSFPSPTTVSEATGSQSKVTYYSGTFNFSLPVGPSGVRAFSNGTNQYYNSVQVGSGTFHFGIAALNSSGSGSGQGTLTVTTTGFCSGSVTLPYTFKVPDATTILGGNLTIFLGDPSPAQFMVPLSCKGPMEGVSTATNNPSPFLPEYPGEITIPLSSLPVSVVQHGRPSANFVWGYSVKETS